MLHHAVVKHRINGVSRAQQSSWDDITKFGNLDSRSQVVLAELSKAGH